MRHRLFCFHMTGALIDGLAAIGVFSFLAFAFLPEWEKTIEASWDDASMCQHFFDYQVTWMKRMGKFLESRTYIMDWSLLTYYNLRALWWFCFFCMRSCQIDGRYHCCLPFFGAGALQKSLVILIQSLVIQCKLLLILPVASYSQLPCLAPTPEDAEICHCRNAAVAEICRAMAGCSVTDACLNLSSEHSRRAYV